MVRLCVSTCILVGGLTKDWIHEEEEEEVSWDCRSKLKSSSGEATVASKLEKNISEFST